MLWGNFAKAKAALIDTQKHCILEAAHPSPLAGGAFFGSRHFSQANEYLTAQGKTAIDWTVDNSCYADRRKTPKGRLSKRYWEVPLVFENFSSFN
jgi:hypothetical protein